MAAASKTACAFRSKCSTPCAQSGRPQADLGAHLGDRLGAARHHPDDAHRDCGDVQAAWCDIIDVSAGQTSRWASPVYGRMFQTPFSEMIRNEVQIPTIAVGNITTADQVNTIVAAGPRRPVCAGPPASDQSAFHAGRVGRVRIRATILAASLSVRQGSGVPAHAASAGGDPGTAAGGKAIKPRSTSGNPAGRRVVKTRRGRHAHSTSWRSAGARRRACAHQP